MSKTQLARDCYDDIQEQYTNASLICLYTGGDGVIRASKEFRMAVVSEIMGALGTDRQNAGTYFSRIFRERHGSSATKKRNIRPRKGRPPFPSRGKKALQRTKKKLVDDNQWLNPKRRSGSHSQDISEQDMGTGFLENLDITPDGDIQAPIKTMDKPTALYLSNEALELLSVLEEYHGLEIRRGKSRWENGFFQMDVRFNLKDSDGNSQTPEAQDFIDYANLHEIPTDLLFKEFMFTGMSPKVDGKTHCIIGWKRRATKNKVLFLRDGKRYVCKVDAMKRYLRKAGLIDG